MSANKRKRESMTAAELAAYHSQRQEAVSLNKEISSAANRKDSEDADRAFALLKSKGWENTHSYSAVIHAHVRTNGLHRAQSVFEELRAHPRLHLDVISATTLMKGHAAMGDVGSCKVILDAMDTTKPRVYPNVRTLNTFLRACVFAGDANAAEGILERARVHYSGTSRRSKGSDSGKKIAVEVECAVPDASSWEYTVGLLCQVRPCWPCHLPPVSVSLLLAWISINVHTFLSLLLSRFSCLIPRVFRICALIEPCRSPGEC
jgi:hypothetical protein